MNAAARMGEMLAVSPNAGVSLAFGKVVSIAGAAMTVDVDGSKLAGIAFTTACSGASAGDRVVIATAGTLSTAIGVIAK